MKNVVGKLGGNIVKKNVEESKLPTKKIFGEENLFMLSLLGTAKKCMSCRFRKEISSRFDMVSCN